MPKSIPPQDKLKSLRLCIFTRIYIYIVGMIIEIREILQANVSIPKNLKLSILREKNI